MKLEITKKTVLVTAFFVFVFAFGLFSLFSAAIDKISSSYLHLKSPVAIAYVEGIDEDATLFVLLQDAEKVELWVKLDGNTDSPTFGHLFLRRDRKSSAAERADWQKKNFKLIQEPRIEIAVIRLMERLIKMAPVPSSSIPGVSGNMLDQTIWRVQIVELLGVVRDEQK